MAKIALITGASAGIGEATAHRLAQDGMDLILTARRKDKLNAVAKTITDKYGTNTHCALFDIRSTTETDSFVNGLNDDWKNVDILVNNAGLALGREPFQDGNVADWEVMFDTNVKGLLYISKLISKGMIERKSGHIVNISSTAATQVYANGNVYCATKHAVMALTKAMRIDLLKYGIKVSSVSPGAVETDFSIVRFKGDKEKADKMYQGYQPLVADDVADLVSYILSRPAHVNINDLEVTCVAQANAYYMHKEG